MTYSSWSIMVDDPNGLFHEGEVQRRDVGPDDVKISIEFCGICHSDLHQVSGDWPGSIFPMVPGHEIVGVIEEVGSAAAQNFAVGQRVGVGCFVGSCGQCDACRSGHEQFCEKGQISTYNAMDYEGNPTYGGYSRSMTVDSRYVIRIPDALDSAHAAPLLCAGVTLFAPMERWGVEEGTTLAVIGMGGIGHIGVQMGQSRGANVTVIGRTDSKKADAMRFGASRFLTVDQLRADPKLQGSFDVILNTTAGSNDVDLYLSLLTVDGVYVPLGLGDEQLSFAPSSLFWNNRVIAGSLIGGVGLNQKSISYCAAEGIAPQIEIVPGTAEAVNDAYARLKRSDVRYRFVIDMRAPSPDATAEYPEN